MRIIGTEVPRPDCADHTGGGDLFFPKAMRIVSAERNGARSDLACVFVVGLAAHEMLEGSAANGKLVLVP